MPTLAERVAVLETRADNMKNRIDNIRDDIILIRRRMRRLAEREPYEVEDPETGLIRKFMPAASIGMIAWRVPGVVGGQTYYALLLEEVEE